MDRDAAGAEACAQALRDVGGSAWGYGVDITDYAALEVAIDQFESAAGAITGLVNNAGWDHAENFLETEPELWRQIIEINLMGPLNVTKLVMNRMQKRRQLIQGGGRSTAPSHA
jgi:2-hydroxycyclohexanecarboxyl-CoA dehydrogenase